MIQSPYWLLLTLRAQRGGRARGPYQYSNPKAKRRKSQIPLTHGLRIGRSYYRKLWMDDVKKAAHPDTSAAVRQPVLLSEAATSVLLSNSPLYKSYFQERC